MLRLTEIKLPIDHPEGALPAAILRRLTIPASHLNSYTVYRRAVDARKAAITFTYTLDVEVRDEPALLEPLKADRHVARAPDMTYRHVGHAPGVVVARPVV